MNSYLIWFPQCQWVYRAFEDVEERDRGAGEKEESPFRPYPVENGSDHEEENGTNGTGKTNPLKFSQCWIIQESITIVYFFSNHSGCNANNYEQSVWFVATGTRLVLHGSVLLKETQLPKTSHQYIVFHQDYYFQMTSELGHSHYVRKKCVQQ